MYRPDHQPDYQQGDQQPFQDYSQQYNQQYDQQYYQQADQPPEEPAPEKKGRSKRFISVGIVLLLLGAVIGVYFVSQEEKDEDDREKPGYDTLIVETTAEPRGLDPATNYETMGNNIIYNVYETLVTYDGASTTDFIPRLATDVPSISNGLVSEDGLNYTFNIRQGVTFHDGTTLDADDVTYSFIRVLRMGQTPSWMIDEVLNESNIVKIGEHTVRFTLESPCAHFLHIMSHTISSIVSMETVETHGGIDDFSKNDWMNENMVGTGPYSLVSWIPGCGDIELEAYDGYWGSTPSLKRIFIDKVDSESSRVRDIKDGYADVIYLSPMTGFDQIVGASGVVIEEGPLRLASYFIALNCQKEPFDDLRVRQAVSYGFDYYEMLDSIYDGHGERYVGPWLRGMKGYDESIEVWEQDLSSAEDLIEDYKDDHPGTIEITLMYTESEISIQLAELFRENCEAIGIDVTLQLLSWPTLLQKTDNGDFDCTLLGWLADFPHPYGTQPIVEWWQRGSANNAWYHNPDVDSLIDNASKTIDDEERLELYHQIHQQVRDDCPYIWTIQPSINSVLRTRVRNYAESINPQLGIYYADVWKTE